MSVLSDEISGDPEGIGYASMSNAAVRDALNAKNYSMETDTTIRGFMMSLTKLGIVARLKDNAELETNPAVTRSICISAMILLSNPLDEIITLSSPDMTTLLGALVQASIVTQAEVDSIKADTVQPASRVEVLMGFGKIATLQEVREARA